MKSLYTEGSNSSELKRHQTSEIYNDSCFDCKTAQIVGKTTNNDSSINKISVKCDKYDLKNINEQLETKLKNVFDTNNDSRLIIEALYSRNVIHRAVVVLVDYPGYGIDSNIPTKYSIVDQVFKVNNSNSIDFKNYIFILF